MYRTLGRSKESKSPHLAIVVELCRFAFGFWQVGHMFDKVRYLDPPMSIITCVVFHTHMHLKGRGGGRVACAHKLTLCFVPRT